MAQPTERAPRTWEQVLGEARGAIKAVDVAMNALGMIAAIGGVQGDWAMDAIREISSIIVGDQPSSEQQAVWDHALGQGRN